MRRLDEFEGPHFWGWISYTPSNLPVEFEEGKHDVKFPFFLSLDTLDVKRKIIVRHNYEGIAEDEFGRAKVSDFCFNGRNIRFTRRYFPEFNGLKGDIVHTGLGAKDIYYTGTWALAGNEENESGRFFIEPFPTNSKIKSPVAVLMYERIKEANDKRLEEARREVERKRR